MKRCTLHIRPALYLGFAMVLSCFLGSSVGFAADRMVLIETYTASW